MRDYVDEFLDAKAVEDGVAINTIKAYRNDIMQFIDMIAPFSVQSITTEDIESYLNKLSENNYSPKTFSRKISSGSSETNRDAAPEVEMMSSSRARVMPTKNRRRSSRMSEAFSEGNSPFVTPARNTAGNSRPFAACMVISVTAPEE